MFTLVEIKSWELLKSDGEVVPSFAYPKHERTSQKNNIGKR